MPLGDDDRRQKDAQKREAAFSRWENRWGTARRRTTEGAVDGFDMLLGGLLALVTFPFKLLGRAWRAVSNTRSSRRISDYRRD